MTQTLHLPGMVVTMRIYSILISVSPHMWQWQVLLRYVLGAAHSLLHVIRLDLCRFWVLTYIVEILYSYHIDFSA